MIKISSSARKSVWALTALAALALLVFIEVILAGGSEVVGETNHDMWAYFYWVRQWSFRQLVHGKVPLWNPHIYCGVPFFGNFQSALLYPPNWIFMFMSCARAMNWSMIVHAYLAGVLAYYWCRVRGISRLGGFVGGAAYMLCGAFFFKICAGWVPLVIAAAWAPLVFISVDLLFQTGRLRWSLLGAFAITMQLLCGSPQYLYNTALVAGLYILLNLLRDRQHWRSVLLGAMGMYILAGGICAVQLFAGADVVGESTRSGGMQQNDATVGPFHAYAFLTALTPYLYGMRRSPVAEGSIRWQMLSIGVVGLVLAIYGFARGEARQRRFSATIIVVLCLVAIGSFSPFFWLCYDYLPGFTYFRASARFTTWASLFLAVLAAIGFDCLRRDGRGTTRGAIACAAMGLLLLGLGAMIYATLGKPGHGVWGALLRLLDPGRGMYERAIRVPWHAPYFARWSANALLGSAGAFIAVALVLAVMRRYARAVHLLPGLLAVEMGMLAWLSIFTLNIKRDMRLPLVWEKPLAQVSPDQRVWQACFGLSNWAMRQPKPFYDANGYEAAILGRYQTFFKLVTGGDQPWFPSKAGLNMARHPGIAQMLRINLFLLDTRDWRTSKSATTGPTTRRSDLASRSFMFAERRPMGRVELIHQYRVIPKWDEVVHAVMDDAFQPKDVVILESEPAIKPDPFSAGGRARVVESGNNEMRIEADVPAPTILLVTDAYSRGWKAIPLKGSTQKSYEIMPANWLLRAIPLQAGKHSILLRYRPAHWVLGICISAVSTGLYVLLVGAAVFWPLYARRKRTRGAVDEQTGLRYGVGAKS